MITLEKVDGATLEAEAEKAGIHSRRELLDMMEEA